jgi:hypothetical protein
MPEVKTEKKGLKGAFWICFEKAPFLNRIFHYDMMYPSCIPVEVAITEIPT